MDVGFSLIIMLKKAFLSRPLKVYEFSTGSVRINSRPAKWPTDLGIVLHIYLKFFEMCKTQISSRQYLVGLEFMGVEISLSFYSSSNVVVVVVATDFGSSGSIFCQVQSGPQSSKTQCLKKRKPALTRSTWGRHLSSLNVPKLHVYHAGDA